MRVRQEEPVDCVDVLAHELGAQIRRRVDERGLIAAHHRARAAATLGRVASCCLAGGAMAKKRRHAAAGARAEEGQGVVGHHGAVGLGRTRRAVRAQLEAFAGELGRDVVPGALHQPAALVERPHVATAGQAQIRVQRQRVVHQRRPDAFVLHGIEDNDRPHVPGAVCPLLAAQGAKDRVVWRGGDTHAGHRGQIGKALVGEELAQQGQVGLYGVAYGKQRFVHGLSPLSYIIGGTYIFIRLCGMAFFASSTQPSTMVSRRFSGTPIYIISSPMSLDARPP